MLPSEEGRPILCNILLNQNFGELLPLSIDLKRRDKQKWQPVSVEKSGQFLCMPGLLQIRVEQIYNFAVGTSRRSEAQREGIADRRLGNMRIVENECLYRLSPENTFTIKDRSIVRQAWAKGTIKRLFVRPMTIKVRSHLQTAFLRMQSGLFDELISRADIDDLSSRFVHERLSHQKANERLSAASVHLDDDIFLLT